MINFYKTQDQLIQHEGLRLKPYKDTTGNITIGIGRNLDSVGLSKGESLYLCTNDINRSLNDIEKSIQYFDLLDPIRQQVLVNLCFNMGISSLLKFTKMLDAIRLSNWDLAVAELKDSKWATQVGNARIQDLTLMLQSGRWT